jgi:VanZ family protein
MKQALMKHGTTRWFSYWLPVAIWLGIIVLESTDMMSAEHTGSWLYRVLAVLFGRINPPRFELLHHVLRKTGHFLGYGVLCVLLFRALRATFTGKLRRYALTALGLTFLVASLDEWHQHFLLSRTGKFGDVLLDTCGAACLQLLVLLLLRWRAPAEIDPRAS